jgi:carbamoyl-phosphate synthase small subunit
MKYEKDGVFTSSFFIFVKTLFMYTDSQNTAVLILEDGTQYQGRAFGVRGDAFGEICFNTGMTGYQEIFTDPSYYGQIMVTTNAHIGNYKIHRDEMESEKVMISGLVMKNATDEGSRPGGDQELSEFLAEHHVVAICDIDTRALVRHIRDKGAMNAVISSSGRSVEDLKKELADVPSMAGLELSSRVSTSEIYEEGPSDAEFFVAALDLGIKKNILRCMAERGIRVRVYPHNTPFSELSKDSPDGYFLSNGPGDPGAMDAVVNTALEVIQSGTPVFGICLGHQVIARSQGISTYKMHNGHRGINHPVKNLLTGKGEITSQNHGFVVNREEVEASDVLEITHVHLNDHTVAGFRMKNKPVFSVQFHPESAPGPHDSRYLFDEFAAAMRSARSGAA